VSTIDFAKLTALLDDAPREDRPLLAAQLRDARVYHSVGDEKKARECVHRFRRAIPRLREERLTGDFTK
jgi:Tfp pilus assembly protein PilF